MYIQYTYMYILTVFMYVRMMVTYNDKTQQIVTSLYYYQLIGALDSN